MTCWGNLIKPSYKILPDYHLKLYTRNIWLKINTNLSNLYRVAEN